MEDDNPYAPPKGLFDYDDPDGRNIAPGKGSGIISLLIGLFSAMILCCLLFWAKDSRAGVFWIIVFTVLGVALGRHALKTDERYPGILGILLNLGILLFIISAILFYA